MRDMVWGFRPPKPRPVVTIDSKKVRGGFHARPESVSMTLWVWKAECTVYAHESADPRGPSADRTGRLVVAVASWPEQGLSGLRVAALRTDGTLQEASAEALGIKDALMDLPLLRAIQPRPPKPRQPTERERLTLRALGSLLVLGLTLTFVLLLGNPWGDRGAAYLFGTRVTVEMPAPCKSKWRGTSGHGKWEATCRAEWRTADGTVHMGTVITDRGHVSIPKYGKWFFTGEAQAYGKKAYAPSPDSTATLPGFVVLSLLTISFVMSLTYSVLTVRASRRTGRTE
ncbi:hypothetical protein [Streptomyces sp. NPDC053048]|uniref:hypothetical protein n=1 Tax=Streptomyces sp. NPDC053048 TaxID=3365694 RepID=UPI0037D210F2